MFGPNPIHRVLGVSDYSHRDSSFIKLYSEIVNSIKFKFSLWDYDIVLIPGPATLGLEAIISSSKLSVEVVPEEGKFNQRWRDIAERENTARQNPEGAAPLSLSCVLETSSSTLCLKGDILDCVSSFPYYPIPECAKFFVLCGNKQLGSIPGISIVGVRKNYDHLIKENNKFSILNLYKHLQFSKESQTLTTASTIVFEDLLAKIKQFSPEDNAELINSNSRILCDYFGPDIIGEVPCPVVTLPKHAISDKIASKWQLYGFNSKSENYQFFTYSGTNEQYRKLISDLRNGN